LLFAALGVAAPSLASAAPPLPRATSAVAPPAAAAGGVALVGVTVDSPDDFARLEHFDLAEARHGDEIHVVAWPGDIARLRAQGFRVRVLVPDLTALDDAIRAEDEAAAARAADAGPRTSYRRLADYEAEMAALAEAHPTLVRLVAGEVPTAEGRTVKAIEIASNVTREDGRPTAVITGLHHAREWPSGEITMDFGHELVDRFTAGGRVHARRLPELALGPPEAAEAEDRLLEARRERRLQRRAEDGVHVRYRHRLIGASGERLLLGHHACLGLPHRLPPD
jgi:hypothetical protein